ncbi:hypothetical protein BB561_000443 [Smittium simulii]|uniref:t-SNARE coiled-coil homology domain-containing protein n=1 Tax=Smittium simulii TaxID=133385 RepID=A0A2T9YZ59_9FUNG|nr:hypothetical protein BB561_000443 [Smittium simulii]
MNDFKKYQSSRSKAPAGAEPSASKQENNPNLSEDEEELDLIKSRITEVKQESLSSTRNALRQVRQTEETATKTMSKLGEQTSQLNRIDKTLEVANVRAEDSVTKTSELKTLNKSIFSISFGNPFNSKKKRTAELEKAKLEHQHSIEESERLRKLNFESQKRVDDSTKGTSRNAGHKLSDEERAKYTFEDEDPEIENEINENLNEISDAVGGLKRLALGMGQELDVQNTQLGKIQTKADDTSAKIAVSQHHLRKIK